MKNRNSLIVLSIILSGIMFMASDCEDNIGDVIEEVFCPSVTTEYEHQQVERNAVFTPCNSGDSGLDIELEMTINGIKTVYTPTSTTISLRDIPRDLDIPIKVTVAGCGVCSIEVQSIGAPLAGGRSGYGGCESWYMNEQRDISERYCSAELNEILGVPLTEDRETRLIVNAFKCNSSSSCYSNDSRQIHITIYYVE